MSVVYATADRRLSTHPCLQMAESCRAGPAASMSACSRHLPAGARSGEDRLLTLC